ncbi:hypothetical protein ACRALDRAFT_2044256 [Sodiomyces alcalophilus JCM 7366]|uniref:uncharacterized protein n=1 Tax=Sodiomyces alcalophilus JCM 7366 TaxID=591952 RepID=UPI0039B5B485
MRSEKLEMDRHHDNRQCALFCVAKDKRKTGRFLARRHQQPNRTKPDTKGPESEWIPHITC